MLLLDARRLIRPLALGFLVLLLLTWTGGGASDALMPVGLKGGGVPVAAAQSADAQAWTIGGAGADEVRQIVVDGGGNEYVAGVFSGTVNVAAGPDVAQLASGGDADIFLAKYAPDGRVLWAWNLGGPGRDDVGQLAVDGLGNVYIGGSILGDVDFAPGEATAAVQAGPSRRGFVAKYDPDGALVWVSPLDLTGDSAVLALALDGAGNIAAAGWTGITAATGVTGWPAESGAEVQRGDAFVLRLDQSGRLLWSMVLPTRSEGVAPVGLAVSQSADLYVTTSYTGALRVTIGNGVVDHMSVGGTDALLMKLTPDGGLVWSRSVGGAEHDVPGNGGVAVDADGNVLLTGTFDDPLDVDGDGLTPLIGSGSGDVFVASFTGDGGHRWSTSLGGPGRDGGHRVAVDAARYVYVTGWFAGEPLVDPAADGSLLRGQGQDGATDVLLAKYSPAGALAWVRGFGGAVSGPGQSSSGTALAIDARGDLLLGGRFFGTDVDIDPGPGVAILNSGGQADGFVARLGPDGALLRR